MIKINTYQLNWKDSEIQKIVKVAESSEARHLLTNYANKIKEMTVPKLPVAPVHKKPVPRLKDALIVAEPKLKNVKMKLQFESFKTKSWSVQIKTKKKQVYYYVAMAGIRKKKILKYTNPVAERFALQNSAKFYQLQMRDDFMNLVLRTAERTNND